MKNILKDMWLLLQGLFIGGFIALTFGVMLVLCITVFTVFLKYWMILIGI